MGSLRARSSGSWPTLTRFLATLVIATSAIACGGSSGGSGGGTDGSDGPAVAPTCLDGAGNPAASCAVTPEGTTCSLGDANACVPLTQLDVYADDGTNGVCLHVVYTNECQEEIYADTCIQNTEVAPGGAVGWQCWTSSVLPGFTIDVSQCHATGSYFEVATASSGGLDLDELKCPAPTPG
jgi:hypothetical protein